MVCPLVGGAIEIPHDNHGSILTLDGSTNEAGLLGTPQRPFPIRLEKCSPTRERKHLSPRDLPRTGGPDGVQVDVVQGGRPSTPGELGAGVPGTSVRFAPRGQRVYTERFGDGSSQHRLLNFCIGRQSARGRVPDRVAEKRAEGKRDARQRRGRSGITSPESGFLERQQVRFLGPDERGEGSGGVRPERGRHVQGHHLQVLNGGGHSTPRCEPRPKSQREKKKQSPRHDDTSPPPLIHPMPDQTEREHPDGSPQRRHENS